MIKNYEEWNHLTCEVETKQGEFIKVKDLLKKAKDSDFQLVYHKPVDWTQPNYYVIGGIVWEEKTFWKNTMLVGCGEAMKIGKIEDFNETNYRRIYVHNN